MTVPERVFLPAVVPPWAAYAIAKECGPQLRELGATLIATGQREMGEQVLLAVASMTEAGRQRLEAHRAVAAGGNAALPQASGRGGSERPPGVAGLTTGEVAKRLGLKVRQVRNLCQPDGPLLATKRGATYFIDEASVAMEYERRRST